MLQGPVPGHGAQTPSWVFTEAPEGAERTGDAGLCTPIAVPMACNSFPAPAKAYIGLRTQFKFIPLGRSLLVLAPSSRAGRIPLHCPQVSRHSTPGSRVRVCFCLDCEGFEFSGSNIVHIVGPQCILGESGMHSGAEHYTSMGERRVSQSGGT